MKRHMRAATRTLFFITLFVVVNMAWTSDSFARSDSLPPIFEEWRKGADPANILSQVDSLLFFGELDKEQRRDAYAIKGSCHYRLGDIAQAKEAFCNTWKLDNKWLPYEDLHGTDEMFLIDQMRLECAYDREETADPQDVSEGIELEPLLQGPTRRWWILGTATTVFLGVVAIERKLESDSRYDEYLASNPLDESLREESNDILTQSLVAAGAAVVMGGITYFVFWKKYQRQKNQPMSHKVSYLPLEMLDIRDGYLVFSWSF